MTRVRPVTHHDPELEREYPYVYGDGALNVWKAIGANAALRDSFATYLVSVYRHSGLTDRQREITILTVAAEIRSAYEWHQHVELATTEQLLTVEEIGALARDDHSSLPPDETALVSYTRAVVRARVTAPVHEAVAAHFDEPTIVGIAALATSYVTVGLLIDALDVELEAEATFVGWDVSS